MESIMKSGFTIVIALCAAAFVVVNLLFFQSNPTSEPEHDNHMQVVNFEPRSTRFSVTNTTNLTSKNEILPYVTIMALSAGERQFDNNILMNALYQTYPHDRLELVVVESSAHPSELLTKWNNTIHNERSRAAHDWPWFYYYHTTEYVPTGRKRNLVLNLSRGDIIVHADNDDILNSQYVDACVQQFLSEATVPTLKQKPPTSDDPQSNVTRCCQDEPAGPLIRNFLLKAPFTHGTFQPDGSLFYEYRNANTLSIGAVMSYTRALGDHCKWQERDVQEELQFVSCVKAKFGDGDSPKLLAGHNALLIRMGNPMSTSNLAYYVQRERWSQLDLVDLTQLRGMMEFQYDVIHEHSRPVSIPRLGQPPSAKEESWRRFWTKHPKLLVGGDPPFCGNFVATPGVIFQRPGTGIIEKRDSTMDCCDACSKRVSSTDKCFAWTYYNADGNCSMFVGATDHPPKFDAKAPNLQLKTQWATFESGVLPEACNKCGIGTDFWKT
eukprot:m.36662 g.36662  ORF g.36662 m.36662 type:complete len:495 (+) comp17420_c0_seq1:445-1929(+)